MPDTYTSQFSGEEIDSALRAAQIFSGADTPAALREKLEIYGSNTALSPTDPTTVETALKYRSNPNLLDNWYFANPVDQRKGYIVPAGVTYYKVEGFVPQGPIPETVRVDRIDYAGSAIFNYGGVDCYVPKDGGYVRGYTPAWDGYSIDRWSVESDSEIVITLVNGGIRVKNTASSSKQFKQILPSELNLVGRLGTISLLAGDVIGTVRYILTQVSEPYRDSIACVSTNGLFSASGSVLTGQQKIVCELAPGAEITLLAAKLELGDTQTLAHKENGVWVLNEIPDFGEQLRRCQRYARAYKCLLGQTFLPLGAYRSDRKAVSFALPTSSFRAVPTESALNDIFQLFDGANVYGITSLAVTDYSDGLVTIYAYTSQPFENGKVLWLFSNTGMLLLSADL